MTVEKFKAPTSGRLVSISVDEHYSLLEEISIAEMREIIAEYEKKRISEFYVTELLPKSPEGGYIAALERYNEVTFSKFFHANYLQSLAEVRVRGADLLAHLRSLTLEEQRQMLLIVQPKSLDELKQVTTFWRKVIEPDFYAMLKNAGSPSSFTELLAGELREQKAKGIHASRYVELLALLWEKGLFIFPSDFSSWQCPQKWNILLNPVYGGQRSRLIADVYPVVQGMKSHDIAVPLIGSFFASSNVTSYSDLSSELIERFCAANTKRIVERYPDIKSSRREQLSGKLSTVRLTLLRRFNAENPKFEVVLKKPPRRGVDTSALRVDGKFNWITATRPELSAWADAMRGYVDSLKTMRTATPIANLNHLGDYLCGLDSPPLAPWDFKRSVHFYDVTLRSENTFKDYIRKKVKNVKTRNDIFAAARNLFYWLVDFLIASNHPKANSFSVPIHEADSEKRSDGNSRTPRDALPPYVINELKQVVLDNDFEFSRSYASTIVNVFDSESKTTARVHDPSLAVCMFTLLDTCLRSHQARWLDSGLLDEYLFDRPSNTNVPNPSPYAIKRRNEGALRLERDGGWLSLWINTNKTADYGSKEIGYSIPFVSEQLAELLHMTVNWQRRYLPELTKPVPYVEFQRDTKERARPSAVPDIPIAPLFRDPSGADQSQPISYPRLKRFYLMVLKKAQENIERKHGQKIRLVEDDGKGGLKWTVDLHSLRVSGITNLIQQGVPIEVVSQFVAGHATLVMTLHYLKYSPAKLRAFIAKAHARMEEDQDFVGSELFTEALTELSPFMLGQEGAGVGPGFAAVKEKTGIITINSEGICPGTSCSTGGTSEGMQPGKFGPVPGGQRCGLCRYWLTGPAFLLGQISAVNNLAYALRRKGMQVAEIEDSRIEAEDAGNQRKARELRDKVDLLRRELEIDVNEWAARYRYAEKSLKLMDDYLAAKARVKSGDKSVPVPILTASSSEELKATLEEAHEFALLDQITQLSRFTTGFKNREAELEKNAVLSRMMVANGIRPMLLSLSESQAHEAGNMLSAVVLQQVKGQDLDEVLSGRKPLHAYPRLETVFKEFEAHATPEELSSEAGMSRLASLLGQDGDTPPKKSRKREKALE